MRCRLRASVATDVFRHRRVFPYASGTTRVSFV